MKILQFFTLHKNIKLCKFTFIKVDKRFYPGPERGHAHKLLNLYTNPPTANMQHSIAILEKRLWTNKAVFLNFCDHFKKMSLPDLLNDAFFIEWVHKSNHEMPTLQSRAFQLALEVTYNKRRFNQKTLEEFYQNDFTIKDSFNINKGACDQSTVYSCVLTKNVTDFFNLDKRDVVVNSTPIFTHKSSITPEMRKMMEVNKKLTDNSMPDLEIKGRSYDFKETTNKFAWNKNNIHLLTLKEIEEKGWHYLYMMEQSLKNQTKISSSVLSQDSKLYGENILVVISKNKKKNPQFVFNKIYEHVLKKQPPQDFRIVLFVPVAKANPNDLKKNFSDEEISQVDLNLGDLTDVKAKKALESIQENWDPILKEKVKNAISGSLSHILYNNNNDDIL